MSEDALLALSRPAPPFAAMQRSSSDNMLAAVMDDDIFSEFMILQPVPCLAPESADCWVRNSDSLVALGPPGQLTEGLDYPLP